MANDIFGEIYKEMGAKPIINAIGSVTLLGGSTPKPVVKEAMDRADAAYVHLPHLQEVVGKKIAEYCNVPAGYVTSGAGAALALAGAFDCFEKISRKQYTHAEESEKSLIEKAIVYANKIFFSIDSQL